MPTVAGRRTSRAARVRRRSGLVARRAEDRLPAGRRGHPVRHRGMWPGRVGHLRHECRRIGAAKADTQPSLNLDSHAWSPDGQKILFQRRAKGKNWEIFVINADGSGQRNLTRNRSHDIDAAWSPDGRSIVFRTSRHGKWELYVMNAERQRAGEADAHARPTSPVLPGRPTARRSRSRARSATTSSSTS